MRLFALPDVFSEIVVLLLVAAAVGAIVLRLRQPLIIGFIAVGILAGPSGFGFVRSSEEVHLLSELGLALLLFVVGLRLDLGLIRSMGRVAIAAGVGQVIFTAGIGYLLAYTLGMTHITAIYVAIALSFSSTIIVVKLLSDKRETDSLHGRISVGILIVQDILVILAMIALSGFAGSGGRDLDLQILFIMVKGLALISGLGLLMYLVLPRLLNSLARSSELLVLFGIAWAVALAGLSNMLGFGKEVGAFLAGVSLASTQYREVLGARLVSLRDFLLLFFFIELGTRLDLSLIGTQVWAAIPLALFVLAGKPLIVLIVMGAMGYRKRTGTLTGLTLAQISEFSLILAAMGYRLGHIGSDTVGLITLVGLTTFGLSSYMILYSHDLYERISRRLTIFERQVPHKEQAGDAAKSIAQQAEIIMFGLGRYGTGVARHLISQGRTVLGVDFDPQAIRRWNENGWIAVFGDAEDPEFPASLPLWGTRWVISSVPDRQVNRVLMQSLKSHGYNGSIGVTAYNRRDVKALSTAGADVVFYPFADAAQQAVDALVLADQQEMRRKMDKLIANLSDHYIVCGYGRMGQQIVKDFVRQNVPYVVIESNPAQIPKLVEQNVPFVEGKASEDEVLIKAGIQRAKGLISVAATDEDNVFITLTARGLNPNLIIVARSIQEENEDKLRRAGADRVMSPYILGGRRMSAAILKPRVIDFLELAVHSENLELEIGDFKVSATAPFAGKTIRDSGIREASGAIILAIRRASGELIANPEPDFIIEPGDEMIVMGKPSQLDAAEQFSNGKDRA